MRTSPITVALCLVVVVADAFAADPPPTLVSQERKALKRVSNELLLLAKYYVAHKAYGAARAELEKSCAIFPDATAPRELLDKLSGKEDQAKPTFAKRFQQRREKTYLKCAKLLAKVAKAFDKRGFRDRFDRHVGLVTAHFPSAKAMASFDLVYFEPYLKWLRRAEVAKLKAGGEFVDGKWLNAAAVKALDAKHAAWTNPWVIADEVHELRTTMPLRTARTLLAHTGEFRRFFLGLFKGSWDLQPPEGKLPVIVTGTQGELAAQTKKYTAGAGVGAIDGAAYYLWQNSSLNPCFVTFEPRFAGGQTARIDLSGLLIALRHELTHQIAFEYSKHDYDQTRAIEHQFWCVEAIANFMQHYVPENGTWRLTHPTTIRMGGGIVEGDFAWCKKNRRRLPRIEDFIGLSRREIMTVENYHIAAGLGYFLLRGSGGRYRASFLKLLERVHKSKDTKEMFAECFPGVELADLQREWVDFVSRIDLD
ncbi:MAG: hypothetical protein ACYTGZ_09280 [Planctomycetota bacterium]